MYVCMHMVRQLRVTECFGVVDQTAYFLMVGYKQRLSPFYSLDYPLGCDTIDVCDQSHVSAKTMTVEEMLVHAPFASTWYNAVQPDTELQ